MGGGSILRFASRMYHLARGRLCGDELMIRWRALWDAAKIQTVPKHTHMQMATR